MIVSDHPPVMHPEHRAFNRIRDAAGRTHESPAVPVEPTGLTGWKVRRACRKAGGHWWHPTDAMIEWGCCQCGARRDGMPRDGT